MSVPQYPLSFPPSLGVSCRVCAMTTAVLVGYANDHYKANESSFGNWVPSSHNLENGDHLPLFRLSGAISGHPGQTTSQDDDLEKIIFSE